MPAGIAKTESETQTPPAQEATHSNGTKPATGIIPASEWRSLNSRRIDLIFKKRDFGLTEAEQSELVQLQKQASIQVNRRLTLDFDALADFEEAAKQYIERR